MVLCDRMDNPTTAQQIAENSPVSMRFRTIQAMLSVMTNGGVGDNYNAVTRVGNNEYVLSFEKQKEFSSRPSKLIRMLDEEVMMSAESLMASLGVDKDGLKKAIWRAKHENNVAIERVEMFHIKRDTGNE